MSITLKPLIDAEKWGQIEQKLEEYKGKIISELYKMKSFDYVTLVQCGGWIKGFENSSFLLLESPENEEASKVLYNKVMIGALSHDLGNLNNELKTKEYVKITI